MSWQQKTSHFKSRKAAIRYYARFFVNHTATEIARIVDQKLRLGEIHLGPPKGMGCQVILGKEGRYFWFYKDR